MSRYCRTPIPTPWATLARWCCARTARWKACTIRVRTVGRRAFSALPLCVVAPARFGAARGRKQDAERKADADAERDHSLRMPADLLAHHVVEVRGAFLHPRDRIARIFRCAVVGIGCGCFRLSVHAFGLLAGLFGGFIDCLAALLECLATPICH